MGIIDKLFGDKKNTAPNLAKFDISNTHFFSIGDVPNIDNPAVHEKYSCRFIKKADNTLRFAVCVRSGAGFSYNENDTIAVSYIELRELHLFTGRIAYIDDIKHSDHTEIEVFKEHIVNIEECALIAVNITALTYPYKQQRREYFRIPARWSVYFRLYDPAENNPTEISDWNGNEDKNADENGNRESGNPNVKSAEKYALIQKLLEASGAFEIEGEHFKVRTVDISAGGFKSKIGVKIPVGTHIECTIVMNGESSEKIAVDGVIVGCEPDSRDKGFYFMRVKFEEMRSGARSAIMKCIYDLERKRTQSQKGK